MTKIIAFFLYILLKTLRLTYRFEYLNENPIKNKKYILAIWHQNIFSSILSQGKTRYATMASDSNDGKLITYVLEMLNYKVVRGSSTRGGKKALLALIKIIKQSVPGALTIDGPQGPAKIIKRGIFELARLSDTSIIPYSVIPESFWEFSKSWDKFRLPRPFTKIYIHYGNAINVEERSDKYYDGLSKILTSELVIAERNIISTYKY